MIEELKKNKFILSMYKGYLYWRNKFLCKISPKLAANIVYKRTFGKSINWENPQNLIEKISWMEIYTDTSLWTKCADKYRVREYIKERGCGDMLVELYGMWENPDDIDFNALPNQFVLKANNGCGTVFLVSDKNKINIPETKKMLKKWLKHPFGYSSGQIHYLDIKRCIIAEELLKQNEEHNSFSPNSIVDYKVWCINGTPESILVTYDRKKSKLKMKLYTPGWEDISDKIISGNHYYSPKEDTIPKPVNLNKMLESAASLSKGFPQMRVDFYIIDNEIKIGELTLSTGYGYFTEEYYMYLGSKVDLSKLTKQPQRTV